MLFEPINHESVADAVIHQIENLIISGVLKEGQRLPPEREMSELLDVSRPKLREALKSLEKRQLIRVQHGGGSYIAPLMGAAMSDALIELYSRHASAFFDYLEYRREQEGFAAQLAAERSTDSDKEILEYIMTQMVQAHEQADEASAKQLDMDFHCAVVDASHNATLMHMMTSIYDLTKRGVFYNRNYLRTIDTHGDMLLQQHRAIGDAILDSNKTLARECAYKHLDFVETSFRAGEKKRERERHAEKRMLFHKPALRH